MKAAEMKQVRYKVTILIAAVSVFLGVPKVSAASYSITNIVDSTTPAPIGNFKFTSGALAGLGVSGNLVAVAMSYETDPSNSGGGMFIGNGGPLTTISKRFDPAPSGVYGQPTSSNRFALSGNVTAFNSGYTGGSGIFTGSGGPLTVIAKKGDVAPGGVFGSFYSDTAISGSKVAFVGSYSPSGASVGTRGLFVGSGGTLTTISKTGDPAPLGTFGGGFSGGISISGDKVAFIDSFSTVQGVFTGSGGPLTTVVKTGDSAPSGTFADFFSPAIDGDNVAFQARYGAQLLQGVFLSKNGVLTTIAKSGDAAPVGTFSAVGSDIVVAGSTVGFRGFYTGNGSGYFVGNGGPLTTVVASGMQLFGSVIARIEFTTMDVSGSGNVAFVYVLADGRSGVALAVPVPEPASACLVFAAASVVCGTQIRRRQSD